MEQKSIELEGTRARLRQLERTSDKKQGIISNKTQQQAEAEGEQKQDLGSRLGHDNYVKFGGDNTRAVTFDLANTSAKKTKVVEVAPAKPHLAAVVDIAAKGANIRSQLPSDAKQRLQEMAGYDVKRNYRKTSSGSIGGGGVEPPRPSRLQLNGSGGKYVSPPSSPVKLQPPDLTSHLTNHRAVLQSRDSDLTNQRPARSSSSLSRNNSRNSGLTSAKSSLNQNIINNNNLRVKTTRDSLSSSRPNVSTPSSQHRTRTPSVERSLPSIKETVSSDSRKLKETVSMLKDSDPSKVRSSSRSFWGGWWKF